MNALVLSLFPGVGLMDRGFEAEGFCVVRGPDAIWGGDIRLFHSPPKVFGGIIAGPPCQDFSTLANVRGKKIHGLEMFAETVRIIKEADPEWFLIENVPRSPDIEVAGYQVQRFNFDAHWFGGDQRRRRKFQFGAKRPVNVVFDVPAFESPIEEPPVTATEAKAGLRPKHRNPKYIPRRPWPVLCRLMGLPEGFELKPFKLAEAGKAIGNGVPVHVARTWAKAIKGAFYAEL